MWEDYIDLSNIVPGITDEKDDFMIIGIDVCYTEEIVYVADDWKPVRQSEDRALAGKFDCTEVKFASGLRLSIPMPRKEFKKVWADFVQKREDENEKREIEDLKEQIFVTLELEPDESAE